MKKPQQNRALRRWEKRIGKLSNAQIGGLLMLLLVLLMVASWGLVQLTAIITPKPVETPQLRINEVSLTEGWVELYNPTAQTISLDGWHLSNKETDLSRYAFPVDSSIPAGGYLLISGKGVKSNVPLQLNFRLKQNSTLSLSQRGKVVDVLSMDIPLQKNASYGMSTDGTFALLLPTPGAENAVQAVQPVEQPVFSHPSGFYDEDFSLSIDVPDGQRVYYTLDGSTPTTESALYAEPLTITDASPNPDKYSRNEFLGVLTKTPLMGQSPVYEGYYSSYLLPKEKVDKCTVLRAIAVDEEGMTSEVATASYFVGYEGRKGYENIPVLSIVSDPDGLYDMEKGIMVTGNNYLHALSQGVVTTSTKWHQMREYFNYYKTGSQWERSAHMDYFNSDKSLSFTQECGLKMHGNTSRRVAQKSFSLFTDQEYGGNDLFLRSFFGDSVVTDKVLLSNGLSPRRYVLVNVMNEGRKMVTQDYQLMQVFLDGEYCGFYAMQEAYDSSTYLEDHYGIEPEDAILLKGKSGHWVYEYGEDGDIETYYQPLLDFAAQNDLSVPENYEALLSMMDVDSFIDYYATQIYIANQDWYEGQNGFLCFSKKTSKSNPYADGRWHWMLYDLDFSTGSSLSNQVTVNTFTSNRLKPSKKLGNDLLFPHLKRNPDFRRQFVTTFMDIANGVYDAASMNEMLDSLMEENREMAWGGVLRYPKLEDETASNEATHETRFDGYCKEIKEFFSERYDYIVPDMAKYFELSEKLCNVTVEVPEGCKTVKLNTLTLDKSWSGQYYSDYPVTLTVQLSEGYVLKEWEVSNGSKLTEEKELSAEVSFTGDVTIRPVVEKE